MNNLQLKEFYSIVIGGTVLCFNAGFINVVTMAGAYSATVSHVTGNITRIGIAIFQEDLTIFALVSSIVASFMFGSFVSGFLIGDSRFQLGKSYGYVLLLESGALLASFIFIRNELVIGEWLAAFACGIQNAMATSYSGFAVRTTHMTGIVTDIGNIIGQNCRSDANGTELWRLKVMVPLLIGYLLGAIAGQLTFVKLQDYAMLFPCIFVGSTGCAYLLMPIVKEAKEYLAAGISFDELFHFEKKSRNPTSTADKEQIEILPEEHVMNYSSITNEKNDFILNDEYAYEKDKGSNKREMESIKL